MNEIAGLCSELSDALVDLDEEKVLSLTRGALNQGSNPLTVIDTGLGDGMKRIGER